MCALDGNISSCISAQLSNAVGRWVIATAFFGGIMFGRRFRVYSTKIAPVLAALAAASGGADVFAQTSTTPGGATSSIAQTIAANAGNLSRSLIRSLAEARRRFRRGSRFTLDRRWTCA